MSCAVISNVFTAHVTCSAFYVEYSIACASLELFLFEWKISCKRFFFKNIICFQLLSVRCQQKNASWNYRILINIYLFNLKHFIQSGRRFISTWKLTWFQPSKNFYAIDFMLLNFALYPSFQIFFSNCFLSCLIKNSNWIFHRA